MDSSSEDGIKMQDAVSGSVTRKPQQHREEQFVTASGGSSGGEATTFGGGMGSASNFFGTAGGLGSGAGTGTGAAAAAGNTKFDLTNGIFTVTGGAAGNFDNQGFGIFGTTGALAIP
jgi:hypothetical protein